MNNEKRKLSCNASQQRNAVTNGGEFHIAQNNETDDKHDKSRLHRLMFLVFTIKENYSGQTSGKGGKKAASELQFETHTKITERFELYSLRDLSPLTWHQTPTHRCTQAHNATSDTRGLSEPQNSP